MNLPLFGFDQNRIWCAIVALAVELTAWMQMLALNGHDARRWEPKRLRLRLFTIPATIAHTGRRVLLHLAAKAPWADLLDTAVQRLRALTAAPGGKAHPHRPDNHGTTPGHLEPAPTRDDTRATVTPPCQNQHRRRRRSHTNTQLPGDERSGLAPLEALTADKD